MYTEIPIWLSIVFMLGGLAALAWSSDVFVVGSSMLAKALGISPFVIGMVIIGFGTSAPELCVSAMAGFSGHANLSLGNAYGSCIFNIAVILGVAALICPLTVKPSITFAAGPMLTLISLGSLWLMRDGDCTRIEAFVLLGAFLAILPIYCWFDQKSGSGEPSAGDGAEKTAMRLSGRQLVLAALKVVVGLAVLIGSSHFLVWGSVDFAKFLGVSDLVIGLTIVAVGTSLPELASAVASARHGENEFVLGNIVGSNLFNMLAVVGVATAISPLHCGDAPAFSPYILSRDLPLMAILSLSISIFGVNLKSPRRNGTVTRGEALVWILAFVAYTVLMFVQETR